MLKKCLSFVVACCLMGMFSSAFSGGPESSQTTVYDGFYVGADAGVSLVTYSMRYRWVLALGVNPFQLRDFNRVHPERTVALAGGKLGYGHAFHNFYLGVEGQAHWGGSAAVNTGIFRGLSFQELTAHLSLKSQYYSLLLKPAYLVSSNTLLYGLLGASMVWFHGESVSLAVVAPIVRARTVFLTRARVGYSIGAGVERRVLGGLSVYINYLYSRYGSRSGLSSDDINLNVVSNSFKVSPSTQMLTLGVSYYF